jgi:hypothetical protein
LSYFDIPIFTYNASFWAEFLVKHKEMNETFQAKQIHIIHMDSVKCEPYFTVNNNDLMEIMRKWTNI